ncbi:hypothetical protein [Sporisorium scitamineum]|uniref:Uncharacterized protein n=1 Tax=Sporisorium scitamineum TaxID=49012 RepID=A0A0F7S1M8_9BASI|nr:hypothetical protein [Sporisorium scitamineum]
MLLTADIFPTGYFVANNAYTMLNDIKQKDTTVYAVNSVPEHLAEAKKHGAIPLHLTNDDPVKTVKEATKKSSATSVSSHCVLLSKHHDLFGSFIQHTCPIKDTPKYYKLFNKCKVLKTVFKMNHAN